MAAIAIVGLVGGGVAWDVTERTNILASGIHKIKQVIMQENRSFDSYFGT